MCMHQLTKLSTAELSNNGSKERTVKLSFQVPYRVNYGQDVAMVGSTDVLGNWDPSHGVGMRWTEGDVWHVDLEVTAGPQLGFEYKYVVRNPDGNVCLWKPGSNYQFSLAALAPVLASRGARASRVGGVAVRDAWDGAVRDVRVQVADARPAPGPRMDHSAYNEALASALDELAEQIAQAQQVSSSFSTDPTSPAMLQADRLVAAAARKAAAAAHALTAATAQAKGALMAPAEFQEA